MRVRDVLRSCGELFLSLLAPHRCPFCDRLDKNFLCGRCQKTLPWAEPSTVVIAPLYYRELARKALLRFKFKGAEWLAHPFGILMAQAVKDAGVHADCIVYVPSSLLRILRRGYRHTRLLGLELSRELSLPLCLALRRRKHKKPQTAMQDDAARYENVKDCFAAALRLNGERVLLCDDVRTSGATLKACREILLNAGAGEVFPVCLCRRGETDPSV